MIRMRTKMRWRKASAMSQEEGTPSQSKKSSVIYCMEPAQLEEGPSSWWRAKTAGGGKAKAS